MNDPPSGLRADTAAILTALVGFFRMHVVLSDAQAIAVALWAAHTHIFEVYDTTPYLIVTSAEPRSGKSRLAIECMSTVVPRPEQLIAPTEAVLFRIIESKPTLLLDETDGIFHDVRGGPSEKQESMRAILNAGYRRGGIVARCIGNSGNLERFDVFAPKAMAGIGHLPQTIEDRGLCIRLNRRMPDEVIARWRIRGAAAWREKLMPPMEQWAPAARLMLQGVYPEMPDELDDRAQDAYEVLIAIADMAGGPWPEQARAALIELRSVESTVRVSVGMQLLRDMFAFADRLARMEHIATADLLAWLYEHGEGPWEEWWGESSSRKASRRLALAMADYDVRPVQFRDDEGKKRGYSTAMLRDVISRYLASETVQHGTTVQPAWLSEKDGS